MADQCAQWAAHLAHGAVRNNTILERLHAAGRITDEEMKQFNIEVTDNLYGMLLAKAHGWDLSQLSTVRLPHYWQPARMPEWVRQALPDDWDAQPPLTLADIDAEKLAPTSRRCLGYLFKYAREKDRGWGPTQYPDSMALDRMFGVHACRDLRGRGLVCGNWGTITPTENGVAAAKLLGLI